MWSPFFSKKPVWLLRGHQTSVMHMLVNTKNSNILISISKDKVLPGGERGPPPPAPETLSWGRGSSSGSREAGHWQEPEAQGNGATALPVVSSPA